MSMAHGKLLAISIPDINTCVRFLIIPLRYSHFDEILFWTIITPNHVDYCCILRCQRCTDPLNATFIYETQRLVSPNYWWFCGFLDALHLGDYSFSLCTPEPTLSPLPFFKTLHSNNRCIDCIRSNFSDFSLNNKPTLHTKNTLSNMGYIPKQKPKKYSRKKNFMSKLCYAKRTECFRKF